MMKNIVYLITTLCVLSSCSRDFLDEKPNSNILTPTTNEDFQRLLDNFEMLGKTSALPHLAADEYYIDSKSNWRSSRTATERHSYIWDEDIYGGEPDIEDWNTPYKIIFYANNILREIDKQGLEQVNQQGIGDVYGQALFHRAWATYDLLKNFAVPFDPATQDTDLGIPLRVDPSIDYTMDRATVKTCYDHIFDDLQRAVQYLRFWGPIPERNRPTKLAVYALLSRIYLNRAEYGMAEQYADSVLNRYDKLIDYNTISVTSTTPFTRTNDELIMYGAAVPYGNSSHINRTETVFVDSSLVKCYSQDDLRLSIYLARDQNGRYTMKRGYNGTGLAPFTGFATDEILLIKAECLIKGGDLTTAEKLINRLLRNRYKKGTYTDMQFTDYFSALEVVLNERRKELLWRCLRWDDIKRLNREGAGLVLTRQLDESQYRLEPGSARYVFNIPQDEINRSGIIQNIR